MPVPPSTLQLFATHLHQAGYQTSTIRSYMSAISFVHKISAYPDPTTDYCLLKLLQGSENSARAVSQKLKPVTASVLHQLVDAVPYCTQVGYLQHLYKSLFLLMFYACLRVGEAVVSNTSAHTLKLQQVSKTQAGYLILFNSYKHSNNNDQATVLLSSLNENAYCPVHCLEQYIRIRGSKKVTCSSTKASRVLLVKTLSLS